MRSWPCRSTSARRSISSRWASGPGAGGGRGPHCRSTPGVLARLRAAGAPGRCGVPGRLLPRLGPVPLRRGPGDGPPGPRTGLPHGRAQLGHKGNDQVRLESALAALGPQLEVLAPVREWNLRTLEDKLAFARRARLTGGRAQRPARSPSTATCGGRASTWPTWLDPWDEPPADVFTLTRAPEHGSGCRPSWSRSVSMKACPVRSTARRWSRCPWSAS